VHTSPLPHTPRTGDNTKFYFEFHCMTNNQIVIVQNSLGRVLLTTVGIQLRDFRW
jgi:hypothetical protein